MHRVIRMMVTKGNMVDEKKKGIGRQETMLITD